MNDYLHRARLAIDDAAGSLDPGTLARKVDTRWSIAEILEHLTLAFTANRASLQKALVSGELRVRPPMLKQKLGRIVVVDLGYFPRREAPSMTRPAGTIPADRALPAIRQALDALDVTLEQIGTRFGWNVPVSNHPYFGGISVRDWQKFHWRHTLHHVKQIRERSA